MLANQLLCTALIVSVAFRVLLSTSLHVRQSSSGKIISSDQSSARVDVTVTSKCDGIIQEHHLITSSKPGNFTRVLSYVQKGQLITVESVIRDGKNILNISSIRNISKDITLTNKEETSSSPILYEINYKVANFGIWYDPNCPESKGTGNGTGNGTNIFTWISGGSSFLFNTFNFSYTSRFSVRGLEYIGDGQLVRKSDNSLQTFRREVETPFEEPVVEHFTKNCPAQVSCRSPEGQGQLKVVIVLIFLFLASLLGLAIGGYYRQKVVFRNIRREAAQNNSNLQN